MAKLYIFLSTFVENVECYKYYVIMIRRLIKRERKKMKLKSNKNSIIFLAIYTLITTMLIINTIKYKLVVDAIYTIIFITIYIRYLYINIFN